MKKAYLVTFTVTTRIIAVAGLDGELKKDDIERAKDRVIENLKNNGTYDHLEFCEEDESVPYDPADDDNQDL
jgi:hypothetical protein